MPIDPTALGQLLEQALAATPPPARGLFFTPAHVPGAVLLEPCAGSGALVAQAALRAWQTGTPALGQPPYTLGA